MSASATRWLVFLASCVMVILEIILPKLVILRWYELNLIEFLPVFYLGLGAGTILSVTIPERWLSQTIPTVLSLSILLAGAAVLVSDNYQLIKLATALPFVPIGIVLGRVFSRDDAHLVYALDLLGIAAGVVLLVAVLGMLGGETIFLLTVLLPLVFAFRKVHWLGRVALGLAVCAVALTPILLAPKLPPWDFFRLRMALLAPGANPALHHSFDLEKPPAGHEHVEIVGSRWDIVARTDLGKTTGSPLNYLLGPSFCYFEQCIRNPYFQAGSGYSFYYNGKWINAISPEYFQRTDFLLAATGSTALVIGMGGGADIPGLRDRGVEKVAGAEINAAAAHLLRQDFIQQEIGSISRPSIVYPLDGRAVVELSQTQYDVILLNGAEIYIPLPYSRVFLESYLYTVDAFRAYFKALSDEGVLYIAKFGSYEARTNDEAYKLILTAMTALYSEGIRYPEQHLQVLAFPISVNVHNTDRIVGINLLKKPLTPQRYQAYLANLHPPFLNLYSPIDPEFAPETSPNLLARQIWEFGEALRMGSTGAYFQKHGLHLEPATDDRPFFYNFDVDRGYTGEHRSHIVRWTLAFVFLPLLLFYAVFAIKNRKESGPGGLLQLRDTPVLVSLALTGFLFGGLQATLGQSFHVFLGSPVYSLLTIFCVFPIMSAIASLFSRQMPKGGVVVAILVLALVIPLLQTFAPALLPRLFGLQGWVRVLVVSLLLAPIALVSGVTFPWLVSPFRAVDGKLVSLLYAWNLGFTVIGSAFALVWASEQGFRAAGNHLVWGYCVLAGVIMLVKAKRRPAAANGRAGAGAVPV